MAIKNLVSLKEALLSPEAEYRSAPFWAWNDKLDKEELEWQIDNMKEIGIGGFFIHSREGLETEYLSDEWMDAVERVVQKADAQKMDVWIYDEDKWPSGSAGGLVSAENSENYTAKAITLQVQRATEECDIGDYKALFKVSLKEGKIVTIEKKSSRPHLLPEEFLLVFRIETSGRSEWYNGYAPSDNLNSETVKAFMQLTHEKYKKRFGVNFGKQIKGFFTDEPNICDFFSEFEKGRAWLPWTEGFEAYFLTKRGYNILDYIPFMFYEGEGVEKIRHDYWRTVTEKFSESYAKQIYEWCDENKLLMTGHMLYENDMGYATRVCGAVMPHYRYMHAPGIDLLGEQTKEYLTVKQCTSVANQFGRDQVLTETYGCTGWELTFEGQKWVGDWQYVMGVNLRCQHLALYSIKGCRKRDYPPAFNYQTTWWKHNTILEEYFGRLSVCVRSGKVERDILMLHPASTIWSMCGSSPAEDFENIEMNMGWLDKHIVDLNIKGEEYSRAAKILLGAHYDFDFGDETIMEEYGEIEHSKIRINKAAYSIVIVPCIKTLFESTVRLLEEFLAAGGKVIWVKPFPLMIEGKANNRIDVLLAYKNLLLADSYEDMIALLKHTEEPAISIKTPAMNEDEDVLCMVRKLEDGYLIFAVNNDRNSHHQVMISFKHRGKVEEYDLLTGKSLKVAAGVQDNYIKFNAEFNPAASKVYFIHTHEAFEEKEAAFNYTHPHSAEKVIACLGPTCRVTRTMPNVLVLDKCHYSIEGQEWSGELDVWLAQKQIRESMQLQQVYYNGAPQRYSWIYNACKTDGGLVQLRFNFEVEKCPVKDTYLVLEQAQKFRIYCNGIVCKITTKDYFIDKCMYKIKLPLLQKGINEIVLECNYTQEMEIEDVYIIGDFGVSLKRSLIEEQKKLHFGDWCMQGYMHYPGSINYHFELQDFEHTNNRVMLKMGYYEAVLAEVRVNNKTIGYMMGKVYDKIDLTGALQRGKNKIDIELVGSLRNMFGPFHQKYTGCSRISWEDFRTTGSLYTPDYVLKPYGIYEQITLYEEK